METNLIVSKDKDDLFRQNCKDQSIKFQMIEERDTDYIYKLTYHITNDLFYLGYFMGLQKAREIFQETI